MGSPENPLHPLTPNMNNFPCVNIDVILAQLTNPESNHRIAQHVNIWMCCIPEDVPSYDLQKPHSNIFSHLFEIWRTLLWNHCLISSKPMPSDMNLLLSNFMNWTWWMKCVRRSSRNLLQPCWLLWKCFNMVCGVSSRLDQYTDEWMMVELLTHDSQ